MEVKVKTARPVIVNRKVVANNVYYKGFQSDGFVSFDSTNSFETTKFQKWFNDNRKSSDPAPLVVDGIYGPLTTSAYNSATGMTYDNHLTGANPAVAPKKDDSSQPSAIHKKAGAPDDSKLTPKKGGMSKGQKIGLGVTGAVVLLLIIILVNKKNRTAVHAHITNAIK